ncbi:hypothetical protein MMC11_005610 [Xylographa trunciseda]|nr:hypothetical protein [Xylographa trunciseda]
MRLSLPVPLSLALLPSLTTAQMICCFGPCAPTTKCWFVDPCPTYAVTAFHSISCDWCPRGLPTSPVVDRTTITTAPSAMMTTPLVRETTAASARPLRWTEGDRLVEPFERYGPVHPPSHTLVGTAVSPVRPFGGPAVTTRVPGKPVPGMPSQGQLSWGYGAGEGMVTRVRGRGR